MTVNNYIIQKKSRTDIIYSMSRKERIDTIDLFNKRFGSLIVKEKVFFPNKGYRGVRWKCECDCGKECVAYGGHLRSGSRRSCGCRHEVNIEKTGCKILYKITQRKCRLKKREFDLTLDEFYKLIKSNCHYCGSLPSQEIKRAKSKKTQIIYNGIDRIDSNDGYTPFNCVSCCKWCNQSKSNMSLDQWKNHLKKILDHLGIK